MDDISFIAARSADWERLSVLIRPQGRPVVLRRRALTRDELRLLGPLYRRTSADLAYAQTRGASEALVLYLNGLVGGAHALLYDADMHRWPGIATFLRRDFPATFRKRLAFWWAALALTCVGATVAFSLVSQSRANLDLFVPTDHPLRRSLDVWMSGHTERNVADPAAALTASALMVNNVQVSFTAFAFGILGGAVTAFVLVYNGMVLGAFAAMVGHAGQHATFWPGIAPHGVVEISEILIAGAAGLSLGWALLAPGRRSRGEAVAEAARDAVVLVVGGVLLLIFAGLVEAFLSPSRLPASLKVTFGITSGVALYAYLFRSGRPEPTGAPASSPPDSD